MINLAYVVNSLVFAAIGVAVFILAFVILDLLTPYKLWQEIVVKQNRALAQLIAGAAVGIGIIIAAAIHG
jgi:putative membrane protein